MVSDPDLVGNPLKENLAVKKENKRDKERGRQRDPPMVNTLQLVSMWSHSTHDLPFSTALWTLNFLPPKISCISQWPMYCRQINRQIDRQQIDDKPTTASASLAELGLVQYLIFDYAFHFIQTPLLFLVQRRTLNRRKKQ